MRTTNKSQILRKLSLREKKPFYCEELYDGHKYMKHWVFSIAILVAIGELAKYYITLSDKPEAFQTYERFLAPGLIVFGLIVCFVSHSQKFSGTTRKIFNLRMAVILVANILFCCGLFLSIRSYLKPTLTSDESDIWYGAIYYISKGVFIVILGTMFLPFWQLKVTVPITYFVGLFYNYLDSSLPDVGLAYAELATSVLYIICIFSASEYFRWRLFAQRSDLEESNLIYESIMEKINPAIAVIDFDGRITYSNQIFKSLSKDNAKAFFGKISLTRHRSFESSEQEVSSSRVGSPRPGVEEAKVSFIRSTTKLQSKLISGKSQPMDIRNINELVLNTVKSIRNGLFTTGTSLLFSGRLIEGQQKIFDVTLAPVESKNKLILILNDTSRIVSLETKNQFKEKLLASASDGLKQQLDESLIFLNKSLNNQEIPHSAKEDLLIPAYRGAKLLRYLISDIIDYSQIKAQKFAMLFKNLSLRKTLINCCQLLEIQAKNKGIKLVLEIENNVPEVFMTDHNRVTQVVLNLILNALKFTNQGKITVKAQLMKEDQIEVSVEDTGIGFGEDQGKFLSELIGVSNQLAKRLGPKNGKGILVESCYGAGSRFHFNIESKTDEIVPIEKILEDYRNQMHDSTRIEGWETGEKASPLAKNDAQKPHTFFTKTKAQKIGSRA